MSEFSKARRGELKPKRFRTNRFFMQNNGWFFSTREGSAKGPFETREQAEQNVAPYIARQVRRSEPAAAR